MKFGERFGRKTGFLGLTLLAVQLLGIAVVSIGSRLLSAELTRLRKTRLRILGLTRARRLTRALRSTGLQRIGTVDGVRILHPRIGALRFIRVTTGRRELRMEADGDGGSQKTKGNKIGLFEA